MGAELAMDKLSPRERELLNRWRRGKSSGAPATLAEALASRFDGEISRHEPMSRRTAIKIGGPADIFLKPRTVAAVVEALQLARSAGVPVHFHGGGANTLVRDGGIRGVVLCLYDALKEFRVIAEDDDSVDVTAEAGVPFSKLVHFSRELAASGLTPLAGIPGCLGGLIAMNAGTREREMKDVVRSVTLLDKDLNVATIGREKLDFGYRRLKIPRSSLILGAVLRLGKDKSREELDEEIRFHLQRRSDTQPLEYPSLGSVFKNPPPPARGPALSAGRLVEEAGLKGVRVGSARVSAKHANFIVNEGGATARDVLALVTLARARVKATAGVELETEIRVVGEDEREGDTCS